MRYVVLIVVTLLCAMAYETPAQADFMVSSAIIEFTSDGPKQKDIDLISRSKENDYIETQIDEVLNAGQPNETRKAVDDATQAGLLVTPDKTILSAGATRLMRFVLLREPDDHEHIYRVSVKPVVKGVNNKTKVGLKILVGYEILIIVRPAKMAFNYSAQRDGKKFTVTNKGNSNILFENGQQCDKNKDCPVPPVIRVYPGQSKTIELPQDKAVDYSVWNGDEAEIKHYN